MRVYVASGGGTGATMPALINKSYSCSRSIRRSVHSKSIYTSLLYRVEGTLTRIQAMERVCLVVSV